MLLELQLTSPRESGQFRWHTLWHPIPVELPFQTLRSPGTAPQVSKALPSQGWHVYLEGTKSLNFQGAGKVLSIELF